MDDEVKVVLNRRHAIGLLGGSAGAALATLVTTRLPLASLGAQAPVATPESFPNGAIIRSLLKDIRPETLNGPVLFHEHLSGVAKIGRDVDLVVDEVKAAKRNGGITCIVNAGHADMAPMNGAPDLEALKRIDRESGVAIVACGGYFAQSYYPSDVATKSAEQIADDFVAAARAERHGAFGEIGQGRGVLTADEKKVFQALGKAHLRTGLPIFTHSPYAIAPDVPRDAALRALDQFESAGVPPAHLCIGHVCCLDDPAIDIAIALAKRGVFVGFDRLSHERLMPVAKRLDMALKFIDAGFGDRLLLSTDEFSTDPAQEGMPTKNGGPGLAYTVTVFGRMLRERGVPESLLRHILIDNPRHFLAFIPRSA